MFDPAESGIRGSQDDERLVMLSERKKQRELCQGILGNSFLTNLKIHIQSTLALQTPCFYGQNPDPSKSYNRGLTGNNSSYYTLLLLWTLLWYQNENFIVLTLDKVDTTYFSYNVIM